MKKNTVYTSRGKVWAEHIVFATHYPITNVPGLYFARQHQERSYVLALAGNEPIRGMYRSIDEKGVSLRSVGNILILGGKTHRTGKSGAAKKIAQTGEKEGIRKETGAYLMMKFLLSEDIPFFVPTGM